MSLLSRLAHRAFIHGLNLPSSQTLYRARVTRGLRVPVEGVQLHADLYQPRGLENAPIVLVRSPYGSASLDFGIPFAERGYQMLLVYGRGTGGSEGEFDPHMDDRRDGLAVLEWIRNQPWYTGSIVTFGLSYLGYTQWAIADCKDADVKAMAMQVTLSNFADMTYTGNSLMLENAFSWTRMMARAQHGIGLIGGMIRDKCFGAALTAKDWKHLPLIDMDEAVLGWRVPFWKDWMTYDSSSDPWWQPMNCHRYIGEVKKPISMVAGWFDIFLPWQMRDFTDLQNAGGDVRITIGPWRHTDMEMMRECLLDAVEWFDKHLHNKTIEPRKRVKAFLVGADQWVYFDEWPPRDTGTAIWNLHAGGVLTSGLPDASSPDSYTYDPENPTPSVGGPALMNAQYSVDNRAHELRDDVLVYTSDEVTADTDIVGSIVANLYICSDAASADFFVRLCDVHPDGASMNVTDGYERVRIEAPGQVQKISLTLWPTAYRLRAGHRLRIQIASGAFPRWSRNLGYGERLGHAQQLRKAVQSIYHDPSHVSQVLIPVLRAAQ